MAQKYVVQVIDDLDGTELSADEVEEVHFGLDGRSYVIDLSKKNAITLRQELGRYADAARRDQGTARSASITKASSGGGRKDLAEVRRWAGANGHDVSSRGRIPNTVLEAFDAR